VEQAKQDRPELLKSYSNLELMAVKEGTVKRAKLAIERARRNDAHRLAPRTFKKAEDYLAASIAELDADRTARENAELNAQRAYMEAVHSEHISELVRDYERRDFSREDIVLWHQDQLASISSPLNKKLTFTESNKKTVSDLNQEIASLVQDRQRLADAIAAQKTVTREIGQLKLKQQETVTGLKKEFAGEKAQLTQAQIEQEARFSRIQKMFSKDEATVYRQGDNILISVRGFKFPPGSSEIESKNFGTMNKIVDAIASFTSPSVKVVGHTDSTGSNQTNVYLSQQRAQGVAKFLVDVGNFPADKIVTEGFGSMRPVASNATPEGRAENRRIEVLIINEPL
jgi:outer membrane protein OmpA-like peptidoglycan-associated protein